MDKEDFRNLPATDRYNLIKPHLDAISNISASYMRILSEIAGLASTMLIIATFNENLVPLTDGVRLIIVAFLLLMLISLYIYKYDLSEGRRSTVKILEGYFGFSIDEKVRISFKDKVISMMPSIALGIFTVLVFMIIWIIMRDIILSLLGSFSLVMMERIGICLNFMGGILIARGLFITKKQAIELGVSRFGSEDDSDNLKLPAVNDRITQCRYAVLGMVLLLLAFLIQMHLTFLS